MAPVNAWDTRGSKWTFCPQSWFVRGKTGEEVRIWASLTRTTGSEHLRICSSCGELGRNSSEPATGSLIHAWPVWSDPTEQLLVLKLWRSSCILVERCRNTQCITVWQQKVQHYIKQVVIMLLYSWWLYRSSCHQCPYVFYRSSHPPVLDGGMFFCVCVFLTSTCFTPITQLVFFEPKPIKPKWPESSGSQNQIQTFTAAASVCACVRPGLWSVEPLWEAFCNPSVSRFISLRGRFLTSARGDGGWMKTTGEVGQGGREGGRGEYEPGWYEMWPDFELLNGRIAPIPLR